MARDDHKKDDDLDPDLDARLHSPLRWAAGTSAMHFCVGVEMRLTAREMESCARPVDAPHLHNLLLVAHWHYARGGRWRGAPSLVFAEPIMSTKTTALGSMNWQDAL